MNTETAGKFRAHWREIIGVFLKLGAMSYGGPAIMGLMQSEVQQKRAWLSKDNFVEGLAFVNMLPGPGATQLGIYLGYMRGGCRLFCSKSSSAPTETTASPSL